MSTIRRKRVFVSFGVGAAALGLATGCTVHPGVDYSRWGPHGPVVMAGSAFCPAALPSTYPGHDPSQWNAVDYMLPGGGYSAASIKCGYSIANAAVAAARTRKYSVHYVVYRQHIWNLQRANEGWRVMENRGSRTANHYDHVHVSFY